MSLQSKLDFGEPFVGLARGGEMFFWVTRNLWSLAAGLETFEYEVDSFDAFDKDVWFGSQHKPTVNEVLRHLKKIEAADFKFPIILSEDGKVLDGVHRICKARLEGRKTIPAVQFEKDPAPDRKVQSS